MRDTSNLHQQTTLGYKSKFSSHCTKLTFRVNFNTTGALSQHQPSAGKRGGDEMKIKMLGSLACNDEGQEEH